MAESLVTPVSQARINLLYPGLRPLVYRVINSVYLNANRKINIAQTLRSMDDQLACYQKGRQLVDGHWVITNRSEIVTNARPGLSWHCYGLALDVSWEGLDPYLLKEGAETQKKLWGIVAAVGRANSFRSGADFRLVNGVSDLPHLELTYGLTIEQAVELYQHGGLKSVWAYIDGIRDVSIGTDWMLA